MKDALHPLLALGGFDTSGLRTTSAARKALDRIAGEGGLPAGSPGRAPQYAVPPNIAGTRGALHRALWQERDSDRAAEPRRLARGRAAR